MTRTFIGTAIGAGLLAAGGLASSTALAQDQQFISIGTGGVTGVYYPAGGAICRLVNKGRRDHGIRCSAESTDGSIYNINTVRAGELEFGVAQSDWEYHSYNGTSDFEPQGPFEGLRSVFSLHPEPLTVLARGGSGIEKFEDTKGKSVSIGEPGSGTRATSEVVIDALGMKQGDFSVTSELKGAETAQALCDSKIDAFTYVVGHPSAVFTEAANTCEVQFVPIAGDAIDKLVEENSYYRTTTIPAGLYKGQDEDVNTFGVGAVFLTSADVSDDVVYTVVKSVFENFDDFKKLHPVFAELTEEQMVSDGLSAPLHAGAEKYYKERGWL